MEEELSEDIFSEEEINQNAELKSINWETFEEDQIKKL